MGVGEISQAERVGNQGANSPFDRSAAFFDLDRTLLAGASGEVLSSEMRAAGLLPASIPGEQLLYRVFNTIGETLPSMLLARQAATFAKGRSRAGFQQAARRAAPRLAELVQPFAAPVIEEHRLAGRPIVLATTTPYDLVAPFAELLGFDDVIATTYGVADDGNYDGTIVGEFVWSLGKLSAVRRWAESNGIELAFSYAYSDSVYDSPLLASVGRPVVVNPDPRMRLMAAARRWPVMHLDVSPGVVKLPVVGLEVQQMLLQLSRPAIFPYAKFDIESESRVPAEGPAILVANHRSYFDVAAMAVMIARTNRAVRFLGKKEVFDAPLIGQIASALGGIRVDRGTGSDEPLQAAADALAGGEIVAIMPQGTIPRGPAFFDPTLVGRWGAARLAEMSRAPVIPVGLWGTEQVWPRSMRLPRVTNLVDPPTVRVRVGEAVELKYRSLNADTRRMMTAIAELLPAEARLRRTPTEAELALTYPPGYHGDPNREAERRPGTD
jgi:putative phosphoserine phosphatase/1-acylglycerol-3-phosphate O-acyltransferase